MSGLCTDDMYLGVFSGNWGEKSSVENKWKIGLLFPVVGVHLESGCELLEGCVTKFLQRSIKCVKAHLPIRPPSTVHTQTHTHTMNMQTL